MSVTIQLANTNQSVAIAALVNQAYRPGTNFKGWTHESDLVGGDRTSSEQVSQQMSPSAPVLVALRDKEVVACVQITQDASDCWIGAHLAGQLIPSALIEAK